MGVCRLTPDLGQTGRFGTHNYRSRPLHIAVVIQRRVLKLGRQNLYIIGFDPVDCLGTAARNARDGKDRTYGSPYQIGIVEVGQRIADNHGINSASICRTQNRSKIARFFD